MINKALKRPKIVNKKSIVTKYYKCLLSSSHQAILVTSKEGKAKSKAQRVKGSGNATNP